jgi:hypothetical protein
MRSVVLSLVLLAFLSNPADAGKRAGRRCSHAKAARRGHAAQTTKTRKAPAVVTARDGHGRIKRSAAARRTFERQSGYPKGRPGYVVDHIQPLACGGADVPSNMQWQTAAEGAAKDKWERAGCR